MTKKDWEVGPVLKNKLGSQGTLFRGGTKYSSDKRYPRGYTPERRDEVAEAIVRPSVRNYTNQPSQTVTGTQSSYYKDRKVRSSGDMSAPLVNESAQPTRNLVDNIARSTVPVAHLRGVQFRTGLSQVRLGEKVAGHWDPAGDALTNGGPVIRLRAGTESTSVPIHEIGHQVSHVHEGNRFPRDENRHSGQEEARADEYAEQHYRDRRGKPVERGIYGGGQFAGWIQRSDEFWRSYAKNRTWGLSRANTAAQDEEYYHKYPEERVHPDNTVDEPLIRKDYAMTGEKTTTMDVNPDALPPHLDFDWSKYHG